MKIAQLVTRSHGAGKVGLRGIYNTIAAILRLNFKYWSKIISHVINKSTNKTQSDIFRENSFLFVNKHRKYRQRTRGTLTQTILEHTRQEQKNLL